MTNDMIRTLEDLKQLSGQILEVRAHIRTKPERSYYFWEGGKEFDDLKRAVAANERLYQRLPSEIKISPEIGDALSKELDEFNKRVKANDPSDVIFSILKTSGSVLATISFPHPSSAITLTSSGASTLRKIMAHQRQNDGLMKDAKDSILGTYKLVKNDSGEFVLKRGKWDLICVKVYAPRGIESTEVTLGVMDATLTDLIFPPHSCYPHPTSGRSR